MAEAAVASRAEGAEVEEVHTRLMNVSLALEESRAFWERLRPEIPPDRLPVTAFEERWFGNKSLTRVRRLLRTLDSRFAAFPQALAVLRRWRPRDPAIRRGICHWHTQLADPLYRAFTGDFLEQRRFLRSPVVDSDVTARWIERQTGGKWAPSARRRMAQGLLAAATAAGLCSPPPGQRSLTYPSVPPEALAYLLYLLRAVDFEGSLLDNPYLRSVGLAGALLEDRLRGLPGLAFQRMGELTDFGWQYEDLEGWADGCLGFSRRGTNETSPRRGTSGRLSEEVRA